MNVLKTEISERADKDLSKFDAELCTFFFSHIEKVSKMPPRRHLRFGLPFNVENVTRQARFVYEIADNTLYILRCFSNHKDYEKWYKSFK